MRKISLLCALFGLLVVVGCAREDAVVSEVVVEITAVTTPTPTQTPIPPTSTLLPTNTSTIMPTSTFTPTQTPFPTRTPFPTKTPIPTIAVASEQYTLTSYDLDTFLHLIQLCQGWESPDDCRPYGFRDAYFPVLKNDFERFYPEGISGAERLIEGEIIKPSYEVYAPFVFYEMVHQGLLTYLNVNDVDLAAGLQVENPELSFNVLPVDLDGDISSEFVIEIISRGYGLQDWMVLDVDENGRYVPIPDAISPGLTAFHTQANVDYDLTGDGIPEVLLTQYDYLTSGSYGGFVEVHTWEGGQLQFLINVPYRSYYANGSIEYEIADVNENGRPEIRILWQRNGDYDCRWTQIDTYEWNNFEFEHIVTGDIQPNTPICKIAQGISGRFNLTSYEPENDLTVDMRIDLLEEGLLGILPEDTPSTDYLTLAKVRLSMLYASRNEDEKAILILHSIFDQPLEGNKFTQIVIDGINNSNDNLISLCDYLVAEAVEGGPRFSDISEYISSKLYPVTYIINLEKVCPINELLFTRLEAVSQPEIISLTDALSQIELPFTASKKINMDDDPEEEWIGIVDLTRQTVVLIDKNGDKWEAKSLYNDYYYAFKIKEFQLMQTSLDDDEFQDNLLLLHIEETDHFEARIKEFYRVLWIEEAQEGLERINSLYLDDGRPILEEITIEDFTENEQPSIWNPIEAEFNVDGSFRKYVDELARRVINQERPLSTLTDLETLLSRLPDDEEVEPLRRQLLFLRGYHYELSGEEKTAVTHYLNLIQQAPDSPWSWLAWARLKSE